MGPCRWGFADQWPVPPTTISSPGVEASSPSIAINTQGLAVAVWIENGIVVTSTDPYNTPWPTLPTTLSGSGASNPQVILDANGNATAVWLENGLVKTSYQPFQGTWATSTTLSGSNASSPYLASNGSGNIAVTWVEGGFIKATATSTLGSWPATPATVSTSGASSNPFIATGDDGTVALAWSDTSQTVYYSSSTINGSWATPQQISGAGVLTSQPQVSVDNEGDVTAAWFCFNQTGTLYSNVQLQVAHLPSGGSWTTPQSIPPSGIKDPSVLRLKLTSVDNYPTIVWTNSLDDATFSSQYTVCQNGTWQTPIEFDVSDAYAYSLDVGVDFRNTGYFVWMASATTSSSIVMYGMLQDIRGIYRPSAPAWTLSVGGNNGYPVVGVCRQGPVPYGAAAWLNNSGSNTSIQAFTSSFPFTQPASNLAVARQTLDLGIRQMSYNLLTWSKSLSAGVVTYLIYRNGRMIGSVPANQLQYEDLNRETPESSTYSVYAVGKSGMLSTADTVVFTYP